MWPCVRCSTRRLTNRVPFSVVDPRKESKLEKSYKSYRAMLVNAAIGNIGA